MLHTPIVIKAAGAVLLAGWMAISGIANLMPTNPQIYSHTIKEKVWREDLKDYIVYYIPSSDEFIVDDPGEGNIDFTSDTAIDIAAEVEDLYAEDDPAYRNQVARFFRKVIGAVKRNKGKETKEIPDRVFEEAQNMGWFERSDVE